MIAIQETSKPLVSVIVLNYNGKHWLRKCVQSLSTQTIRAQMEVIVADNQSADGSDRLAAELMAEFPNGQFISNGGNLGFAEGNNIPAQNARGQYLFFLNNDAWLEPDCLEQLLAGVQREQLTAACPLVLNYDDNTFQSAGAQGFDIFGLATARHPATDIQRILMPEGCGYLIERTQFLALGGFDPEFFMYAEEYDLSWRVWLAGGTAGVVPAARMHHRGAAQVNPLGGAKVVEFRTSDRKRYYANRNHLLVLAKNAQHLLFCSLVLQGFMLLIEALAAVIIVRRRSFIKTSYIDAIRDCWRLRKAILHRRKTFKQHRVRSDFWMLRHFRLRPNRWDELTRMLRLGPPKVSAG
jgi:GT2 family glycosyltransferase